MAENGVPKNAMGSKEKESKRTSNVFRTIRNRKTLAQKTANKTGKPIVIRTSDPRTEAKYETINPQ